MLNREIIEKFLEGVIDSLSISASMAEKAKESYESVGRWLGSGNIPFNINIMPQGSFSLGTIIKPISEIDDYDIDLVCLLNTDTLDNYSIKNLVGKRLKESEVYKVKLEPEGKRCWTLDYNEFHMDILPCIPEVSPYCESNGNTTIHLTHKNEEGKYLTHYSNPHGYQMWFESRMEKVLLHEKTNFSIRARTEISKIKTFQVKTPLQKVIQLLKRHRDIMFANDDNAPISIIITTLAAQAYNGEENLLDALDTIIGHLKDNLICNDDRIFEIRNPVQREENFADKWKREPEKAEAFFKWYEKLKNDFSILFLEDLRVAEGKIKKMLGEKAVQAGIRAVWGANALSSTRPRVVSISAPNRPFGDDIS